MTPNAKPSVAGTVVLGALVAAPWALIAFQLFVMAPRFKTRFDEFGLKLPAFSELVVAVADLWWVTAPLLLLGAVGTVVGVALLRHGAGYRAKLPVALVLLALSAVIAMIAAGLVLPMMKLQEGLAK